SAAVLLPNSALLMPVLHHLPERDKGSVNVTMGASLDETPAAQLIRACMAVQLTKGVAGDLGRCHWKELVALFQHPLLHCLVDESGLALGPMLDRFCQAVRTGLRYTDPWKDALCHEVFANRDLDRAALSRVLAATIAAFAEASTPRRLGEALQGLCDFIRRRCPEQVRATASMDMEALHRIEHAVVPMLQGSLLADEELPLAALASLLDGLLAHERVFFEPGRDRLVNLQVMGVLESSLLHFDRVYVVDATDDRLPGGKRRDPLLPDSLRALIGLPDLDLVDQETGYAVYRLARSASELHFYWQEGMGGSSLFDGKKFRSRFAEEFIWEQEQQAGRIFAPGEPPLELAEARLVPMHPADRSLSLAAGTRALARMEQLLEGPLSPTMLDEYLHCPASFGFHRLARLREMEEVNEGDDPSGVGTLIHEVLEQFHMRRLNQPLERSDEEKREIVGIFHDLLHDESRRLVQDLPPESLAVLEAAAPPKLRAYIDRQPANALPCLLECSFAGSV
ncbi:MAG: PD-(D/E)XK nuclease family protein, partial [Desulfovibrio sp.]|nr:PD-(D/E)XK nuclease family protein [Desulfovibrio sp.]